MQQPRPMKNRQAPYIFIAFCFILAWLSINFFATHLCDEVCQVSQWQLFCIRGGIVLIAIGLYSILCKSHIEQMVRAICWCIIAMGVAESVTAMMQLYGFGVSNNGIYKETGTFYNPGPLGGYLAVCIPVAFGIWRTSEKRWAKNVSLAALAIMVMTEPSTMSRSGWIGAAIGTLYVAVNTCDIRKRLTAVSKRSFIIGIASLTIAIIVAGFGIWHIKSDSASGRLFLWKISCKAIMESPMTGHTSFAEAYGDAQEKYFANGGTEQEMLVAGSPDYAFNEYLHYSIEWGVPAVVAIIAIVTAAIIAGHRKRRYSLCGGIIAMCVFAFSSYPMHIPAFVALLAVMIIGCIATEKRSRYILGAVVTVLGACLLMQHPKYAERQEAMQKWENTRYFYNIKKYNIAVPQYEKIYEEMKWNGRFLYEYGHSLHCNGEYGESNRIMSEAIRRTCDPMVLNIIGKNYRAMGNYAEAETYFRRSTDRLPERIYPHYLLYQLYSEKDYDNEKKRKAEADIILNHKWKVESDATREIKEKTRIE